ncbi:hypothetical protein AV926_11015 [Myroides marinus]|uniref:Lipoprotein n=1 Tax=Myroides marinus TaxID=703342 RepID=A0A161S4U1_9FLAO|nr:hypothetical protein [Myroides marinus]KZE79704.1 hypothetical protein AV926_11015 [Myroides marinus]
MNKLFLSIAILSAVVTMSSCKKELADKSDDVEAVKDISVVEEESTEDLLNVLTNEEDLLVGEYNQTVAKENIEVFNRINSFSAWSQVSTIDFTTEKGTGITKLYYNKELQVDKIVVRKYDTEQQSLDVYYLSDGKLVLVINQGLVYNANPNSKEFNKEESEYTKDCNYFHDGKLFAIMSNLDCGAPFAEDYVRTVEKDILEEVKKLIP